MRITFAYPKIEDKDNSSHVDLVRQNIGCLPPLSLTFPAATLREEGHQVRIIDGNALNLSKEQFLSKIRSTQPDIVGFNLSTFTFHKTLEIIKEIKSRLKIPIFVGGKHVEYYPKDTIKRKEIDYALSGEADHSSVQLIKTLESENKLSKVKGLLFKKKDKIIRTPRQDENFSLDDLPTPAYDLLPIKKYYTFVTKRRNFSTIITSRGCPFKCIYCGVSNTKVRFSSPEKMIKDLKILDKLKVREVEFYDNSFTLNKERVIEFCRLFRKENLDMTFNIHTRADLLDRKVIDSLSKSNCKRINIGIESADNKILTRIKKEINIDKARKVIRYIKKKDITLFGYFIMGSPYETFDSMKKNLNFAKSLPFDYVQFTRMVASPSTELNDIMIGQLGVDLWEKHIKTGEDINIPLVDCDLTSEQVDKFIERSYKEFYLRPSKIYKILSKTRSFKEFGNYIKAGFESLYLR